MTAVTDATIWRYIKDVQESSGWPPDQVKQAVAETLGVDLDRVSQVWRERIVRFGG